LGGLDDGTHGGVLLAVRDNEFDFDLGQEVHGVFAAAIDFGVALLAANPFDAEFAEGVLHFFKLEWFDDGFNFLHSFYWWFNCLGRPNPSSAATRGRNTTLAFALLSSAHCL